jgi:hypothetical protein
MKESYTEGLASHSDSEGIWTEIQARLMDKNGFSAQSMTPIIPQNWL